MKDHESQARSSFTRNSQVGVEQPDSSPARIGETGRKPPTAPEHLLGGLKLTDLHFVPARHHLVVETISAVSHAAERVDFKNIVPGSDGV